MEDTSVFLDAAVFGLCFLNGIFHQMPEPVNEFGTVAIHGQQVGHLGAEAFEEGDRPPAVFIDDGRLRAVSESTLSIALQAGHILDQNAVFNVVIIQDIAHAADADIAADDYILQGQVVKPDGPRDAFVLDEGLVETADADVAGEMYIVYIGRIKSFGHLDLAPVKDSASLGCQGLDFLFVQRPIQFLGVHI
jgi:hypothetical protein